MDVSTGNAIILAFLAIVFAIFTIWAFGGGS